MPAKKFKVVSGPNKWDLAMALFREGDGPRHIGLFKVEDGRDLSFVLESIEPLPPLKAMDPARFLIRGKRTLNISGSSFPVLLVYAPEAEDGDKGKVEVNERALHTLSALDMF